MNTSTQSFQVGDWVKVKTPQWGVLAGKIVQITIAKQAHLHIQNDADGRTYGVPEAACTVLDRQTPAQRGIGD
jgi:hypothetical protein